MSTACLVIIGILCVHVDYLGGSGASVRVGGAKGLGGTAVIESSEGWRVDYSIFTDVISTFYPVGAEHACVKDVCVDYHRKCKRDGEATTCTYVINFGRSIPFTVRADNDAALNLAMRNVAIYKTTATASDFPLAILDKDTNP